MKRFLIALALTALCSPHATAQITPAPVSVEGREGVFVVSSGTLVTVANKDASDAGEYLIEGLGKYSGISVSPRQSAPKGVIRLAIDTLVNRKDEGYELSVSNDTVTIAGAGRRGLMHGIQSFLQLVETSAARASNAQGSVSIPCFVIKDEPRFKWRGVHLDVARHFQPVSFIKKYLDVLALYKFNTFHWHLTDDQGWRIEIKKYPKLTEIGGYRAETMGDSTPYGGFYTQDEIREVVAYASRLGITVVPEIEMPGHALAALAAYPEYSCTGGPHTVATTWGIFPDVYCPGKESTFVFLQNILSETLELFPSTYIHIGGDEVPKDRWNECSYCQNRMKEGGLKDAHELQTYFITRIEKFLNAKGRRIIGWDEILEGGLAPNATVMSWRGTEGGIEAAKAGHDVVMTPYSHCYFDYYQGMNGEPKAIGGFTPIEKVYMFEPVPEELTPEESKFVLGAQANLWTEYISASDHVEYMLLPRLLALSEVLWSPASQRSYDDFERRLLMQYDVLARRGYNYRVPTPFGLERDMEMQDSTEIVLLPSVPGSSIVYTLDGSEPTASSRKYDEPIPVKTTTTVRARTLLPNGRMSVATGIVIRIATAESGNAKGMPHPQRDDGIIAPIEANNFSKVTTHVELMNFVKALPVYSKRISVSTIGTTTLGKEIPLVRVSEDETEHPDRLRVLLICSQHGNEPSGKEAALMMLARMARGEYDSVLKAMDLWVIPSANPDGNDMAQRQNAAKADLNRDHLILAQPETRAIHRLFDSILPDASLDVHEFGSPNDSWRKNDLSRRMDEQFGAPTNLNVSQTIRTTIVSRMFPQLDEALRARGVRFFNYIIAGSPSDTSRYSTTDVNDGRQSLAILNTFSCILEGRSESAFDEQLRRRVVSQQAAIEEWLLYLARNAAAVKSLVKQERDAEIASRDSIVLRSSYIYQGARLEVPARILSSGKDTSVVLLHRAFTQPLKKTSRPAAYVIPAGNAELIAVMERHNVRMSRVGKDTLMDVTAWTIIASGTAWVEDDNVIVVEAAPRKVRKEFPKGSVIVSTEQLKGEMACLALEPESQWGLVQYHPFERLRQPNSEFPVYRLEALSSNR